MATLKGCLGRRGVLSSPVDLHNTSNWCRDNEGLSHPSSQYENSFLWTRNVLTALVPVCTFRRSAPIRYALGWTPSTFCGNMLRYARSTALLAYSTRPIECS